MPTTFIYFFRLKEEMDKLHEELIDNQAKRNHIEQLFNELSKEMEMHQTVDFELKDENDKLNAIADSQSKIIKSYELLWNEISAKIKDIPFEEGEVDFVLLENLELPQLIPEIFENEEDKVVFLNQVCGFENAVKHVLDYIPVLMQDREDCIVQIENKDEEIDQLEDAVGKLGQDVDTAIPNVSKSRKNRFDNEVESSKANPEFEKYERRFSQLKSGDQDAEDESDGYASGRSVQPQSVRYRNALSDFRDIFGDCLGIFEGQINNPKKLRELIEVVTSQIEAKLDIEQNRDYIEENEIRVLQQTVKPFIRRFSNSKLGQKRQR